MKLLIYLFFGVGVILISLAFTHQNYFVINSDVIIVLKNQVDYSKTNSLKNKNDKGWYIYNESKKIASHSQKEIINYLNRKKIQHQSFHIINSIHIPTASSELIHYFKK